MSALTEAMYTYWWLLPLPFIAAGVPFSVMHIVANVLIFAGVGAFVFVRGKPRKGTV